MRPITAQDQKLLDALVSPETVSVATKPLTYSDLLAAHEKITKDVPPTPILIYHPNVIEAALDEGVMRKDENGRVWTYTPSIPYIHNIEVFPSPELETSQGMHVAKMFVDELTTPVTLGDLEKGDRFFFEKGSTHYTFIKFKPPYANLRNKFGQSVYVLAHLSDEIKRIK